MISDATTTIPPLIILREFWKFIKQILGQENIFGYQTTAANQLYLLYCLSGKIYFTDKVHPSTKYFWLILNVSGLSIAYAIALAYFLYDTRQELIMRLTILYALGTSTNIVVVFPIISYRNRRGIEAAIRVLDEVLQHSESASTSSNLTEGKINLKTMLAYNCCVTLAMNCVYGVMPYLDVMIFYEEEKVKNAMYYTLPLPNIHECGSMSLFSASAGLISSFYSVFALEWIAMINFILFWGVSCHNELINVYHRLGEQMELWSAKYEERYEYSTTLEAKFRSILKRNMDTFNQITRYQPQMSNDCNNCPINVSNLIVFYFRAIENYREFVELFCSMAIPVIYLIQVVQLYTVISVSSRSPSGS